MHERWGVPGSLAAGVAITLWAAGVGAAVPDGCGLSEPPSLRWVDPDRLAAQVSARAPARLSGPALPLEVALWVDGARDEFRLEETEALVPELATRYPGIRTFAGPSTRCPDRRLRLTLTPERIYGTVFLPGTAVEVAAPGAAALESIDAGRAAACTADLDERNPAVPLSTRVEAQVEEKQDQPLRVTERRTYRLAVAAPSGFAAANGRSAGAVLGAITASVHNVNEVTERDLGVRFQIVPETERVIFTDPREDPFTAVTGDDMLDQSQAVLDCLVGSDRYDVGHTLHTHDFNLAEPGSAGLTGRKGRGATGAPGPGTPSFDLEVLAHELGHQLGAGHTYTGILGACKDFFDSRSAVEPGSGSTVMSYAGHCGTDDLQDRKDFYFHAWSIEEIVAHRELYRDCQPRPDARLKAPEVDAGEDVEVPCGTGFMLDPARGGGGSRSYTWEQIDPAPSQATRGTSRCEAIYQSVPPSLNPGQDNPGLIDCRPRATSCPLTFVFASRDHRLAGGGVSMDRRTVNVRRDVGPFEVRTPAGGEVLLSGPIEVAWSVHGTDELPGGAEVVLWLLCRGEYVNEVPARVVSNSGLATVDLPPDYDCDQARVRIESEGNVFFAQSEEFRLEASSPPP